VIKIERLDGREVIVNADLIELIESTPDTVVTLTTGKKIIAKDTALCIVRRAMAYRRRVQGPRLRLGGTERRARGGG